MATEIEIRSVRENLPAEAATSGWDDVRIGGDLDAGISLNKIVQSWWAYRVSSTASFVDISESGSSRSLGSIHRNAVDMLKYWDDKVKDDEDGPNDDIGPRRRIAFHKARRV